MIENILTDDKNFAMLMIFSIVVGGFIGYFIAKLHTSLKNRRERDKSLQEANKILAKCLTKCLCVWREKYYVGSNCYDTSCGVIVQKGECLPKNRHPSICHVCDGVVLYNKFNDKGDK